MFVLKYLIAGFIGFMLGTIITCILLAKKNLERYQQISNSVEENIRIAKNTYKAMTDENYDTEEETDE